ncbi:MAG: class I adenylate-forming enzyme family protein [Candidatus Nanopelagicales bacterium]
MTAFQLTAAAAHTRSTAAATAMASRGVAAGDRVGIVAPDATTSPSHAAAVQAAVACTAFGALRMGALPVMVNTLLAPTERQGYLDDAECRLVLADSAELLALTDASQGAAGTRLPELADMPLGRPMHFTSGTTGRSKGVWSGPVDESAAASYWADEHDQWRIEAGDVVLNHGPLAHSAPLRFSMLAFLRGASVVYTGAFDAERIAAAVTEFRPTVAMAVPTHLQRLLDLPGGVPPSSYRMLVHAGSSCPPDLKRRIHDWAGVAHVWEFLGSTEGQFTACTGAEWEERPGTLGRARTGRTLSISAVSGGSANSSEPSADPAPGAGVIWCSAPDFARFEYFGDPAKTAAAWRRDDGGGAFTVGDLGRLDDDGYLYLHGRRTDLIVTGGVNVYPAEVEAELRRCPGVRDAAVFGEPDPVWGDRVVAAIVGEAAPDAVRDWARHNLAAYRRPKRIAAVAELPLTSNGKVRRDGLAQWVARHSR